MENSVIDCNLDLVVEMEEMGVGVEEILQYARAIFDHDEMRSLASGIGEFTRDPTRPVPTATP